MTIVASFGENPEANQAHPGKPLLVPTWICASFFLFLGGLFGRGFGGGWGRFWEGFGEVLGRFSGVRKPIKNVEKRIKTYKPYKKDFPFFGLRTCS